MKALVWHKSYDRRLYTWSRHPPLNIGMPFHPPLRPKLGEDFRDLAGHYITWGTTPPTESGWRLVSVYNKILR